MKKKRFNMQSDHTREKPPPARTDPKIATTKALPLAAGFGATEKAPRHALPLARRYVVRVDCSAKNACCLRRVRMRGGITEARTPSDESPIRAFLSKIARVKRGDDGR